MKGPLNVVVRQCDGLVILVLGGVPGGGILMNRRVKSVRLLVKFHVFSESSLEVLFIWLQIGHSSVGDGAA